MSTELIELERLCQRASREIEGWDAAHVRLLTEVGEFGLAVDEIAAAYLAGAPIPSAEVNALIRRLAAELGLADDEEYAAAAEIQMNATD